jgi:hypothetical protein
MHTRTKGSAIRKKFQAVQGVRCSGWLCVFLGVWVLGAVCPAQARYDVVISEFMAQNATTLPDDEGECYDWIELHNLTDQPISLFGWRLTDDPADLEKWTIPNVEIAANGYLVIFASGKNLFTVGEPLHTNFTLKAGGAFLALVRYGTPAVIAHSYAPKFPPQSADISYGQTDPADPTSQGYLPYPTPGKPNPKIKPKLLISEIMADNTHTLRDKDGDYPDWIEIYNPSTTETVSLLGWGLSDDPRNKTQWTFPDVSVAPDGRIVVFASKKNLTNPTSELHTSFSLSASGEYLGLCMPDGKTMAYEFAPAYPALLPDVAFGIIGSNHQKQYLVIPTPGAANDPTPPIARAKFQASQGAYLQGVRLNWNEVPGADHYRIWRSEPGSSTKTPLTGWLSATTAWRDVTAEPDQIYGYCLQTSGSLSAYPTNEFTDTVSGWRPGPDSLQTYRISVTGCTILTHNSPDLETTSTYPSDITCSIRRIAKAPASVVFDDNGVGRDTKNNLYVQAYRLPRLTINGDVEVFYTDLGIDNLVVDGKMEALTANRCWVANLEADFYETIRMNATENSTPVDGSMPRYATTRIVGTRAPKNKVRYVNVSLAGVSLEDLDLPYQPVTAVRISSKKGLNPATKEAFLSYGGATGNRLRVKQLGVLSARGSSLEMNHIDVLQGAVPATLTALGMVFQTGLPGQRVPSVWAGDIRGAVSVSAPNLGVSATGGSIETSDLRVTGVLRSLSARHLKVRTGSTVELVGGLVGQPLSASPADALAGSQPLSLFLAGSSLAAPKKDILSVLGTRGVRGAFVAGGVYAPAKQNRVVPNCEGVIYKIATGKPDSYGTPGILGESWSNSRRVIQFLGDKGTSGTPEGFSVYDEADLGAQR